jgi:hypothetical protein
MRLTQTGAVHKLGRGLYGLPGAVAPAPNPEPLGPALQRVYDLLELPRTPVELRETLGVTRQAIEQTLKRLVTCGLVKRVDTEGEPGDHVYLRADQTTLVAMLRRSPKLRKPAARLLSSVPGDGAVRLSDLVGKGPDAVSRRTQVKRLSDLALVEISGVQKHKIVRLTQRGRQHPQFDFGAEKLPALRHTFNLGNAQTKILLTIYALGEAQSIDVTLLTGIGKGRKGRGSGVGNYMQYLRKVKLVECVAIDGKRHPRYRLTPGGRDYIALLKGEINLPDSDEMRSLLNDARQQYQATAATHVRNRVLPTHGSRPADVLTTIARYGPLERKRLNALLPNPYSNLGSLLNILREFKRRGKVVVIRDRDIRNPHSAILWGMPSLADVQNAPEMVEGAAI